MKRRGALRLVVAAAASALVWLPDAGGAVTDDVQTIDLDCGYDAGSNTFMPVATVARFASAIDSRVTVQFRLTDSATLVATLSGGRIEPDGSITTGALSLPSGATARYTPGFGVAFGDIGAGGPLTRDRDYAITVRLFDFESSDVNLSTPFTCRTGAPVIDPPTNSEAPQVRGLPKEGTSLTGDVGVWNGTEPMAFEFLWTRCPRDAACVETEVTTQTYPITAGDDGSSLTLKVTATNAGGSASSQAAPFLIGDFDEDAIPDQWELSGADVDGDGVVDVPLPDMGSEVERKDIYVEVDNMIGVGLPNAALNIVTQSFMAAPVSNPDGTSGINLHIDNGPSSLMNPQSGAAWGGLSRSTAVPYAARLGTRFGDGAYNWSHFDAIKSANLDAARRAIFHYAVQGDGVGAPAGSPENIGGISRNASDFFAGAGDFIVGNPSASGVGRAGTFMHELGHNLGLGHGGRDHIHRKPNYLSIMNYVFQLSGLQRNGVAIVDFSRFGPPAVGMLHEGGVFEPTGVVAVSPAAAFGTGYACPNGAVAAATFNSPIDFNCDGAIVNASYSLDYNADGFFSPLIGYEDWSHLVFAGGAVGDLGAAYIPPVATAVIEPPVEELEQWAGLFAPADYVPAAQPLELTSSGGASVPVTLSGTDPNGGPLTFSVIAAPAHGTVSGTGAVLEYRPTAGFSGVDSFQYVADDGVLTSAPATVTITVTAPAPTDAGTPATGGGSTTPTTTVGTPDQGTSVLGTQATRLPRTGGASAGAAWLATGLIAAGAAFRRSVRLGSRRRSRAQLSDGAR